MKVKTQYTTLSLVLLSAPPNNFMVIRGNYDYFFLGSESVRRCASLGDLLNVPERPTSPVSVSTTSTSLVLFLSCDSDGFFFSRIKVNVGGFLLWKR